MRVKKHRTSNLLLSMYPVSETSTFRGKHFMLPMFLFGKRINVFVGYIIILDN